MPFNSPLLLDGDFTCLEHSIIFGDITGMLDMFTHLCWKLTCVMLPVKVDRAKNTARTAIKCAVSTMKRRGIVTFGGLRIAVK
jgi:hypothetical protein